MVCHSLYTRHDVCRLLRQHSVCSRHNMVLFQACRRFHSAHLVYKTLLDLFCCLILCFHSPALLLLLAALPETVGTWGRVSAHGDMRGLHASIHSASSSTTERDVRGWGLIIFQRDWRVCLGGAFHDSLQRLFRELSLCQYVSRCKDSPTIQAGGHVCPSSLSLTVTTRGNIPSGFLVMKLDAHGGHLLLNRAFADLVAFPRLRLNDNLLPHFSRGRLAIRHVSSYVYYQRSPPKSWRTSSFLDCRFHITKTQCMLYIVFYCGGQKMSAVGLAGRRSVELWFACWVCSSGSRGTGHGGAYFVILAPARCTHVSSWICSGRRSASTTRRTDFAGGSDSSPERLYINSAAGDNILQTVACDSCSYTYLLRAYCAAF
ncbi:hypothetical protein NPIL_128211 [Nephila pilipes]|uniref:Uncharacterized protein n=1 Tax=Nephila pilipes TaxID=299642 RepID=A0A8X6PB53_NEPPI|nr:hypothetical protein NPIL_128211 [Nephila pilipes]